MRRLQRSSRDASGVDLLWHESRSLNLDKAQKQPPCTQRTIPYSSAWCSWSARGRIARFRRGSSFPLHHLPQGTRSSVRVAFTGLALSSLNVTQFRRGSPRLMAENKTIPRFFAGLVCELSFCLFFVDSLRMSGGFPKSVDLRCHMERCKGFIWSLRLTHVAGLLFTHRMSSWYGLRSAVIAALE